eukprot:gb/GEZN01005874.1/.p1 GENE.gb/GEZN01005874.1/~~gb/GEZN01005874.1/.p1  ORF type:complete len:390 (+),score=47.48 gb/GEZN01005874.1/:63-1232(+)
MPQNKKKEKRQSRVIDMRLLTDKRESERKDLYILLLGDTHSKNTLLAQLQVVFGTGFAPPQRTECLRVIQQISIRSLHLLLRNLPSSLSTAHPLITALDPASPSTSSLISPEAAADILVFLATPSVASARSNQIVLSQLSPQGDYFLTRFPTLHPLAADKLSDEDCVRCAALLPEYQKSGLSETKIIMPSHQNMRFLFLTLAGYDAFSFQKQLHLFDRCAGLIYAADLTAYDHITRNPPHAKDEAFFLAEELAKHLTMPASLLETIVEYTLQSGLDSAVEDFRRVANSKYLRKVSKYVFLNRPDDFRRKLETVPFFCQNWAEPQPTPAPGAYYDQCHSHISGLFKGSVPGDTVCVENVTTTLPDSVKSVAGDTATVFVKSMSKTLLPPA